jgi:hypothetical protein
MEAKKEKMTPYEYNEYEQIIKWQNEEPSVVSQTINGVLKPVSWLIGKIVPPKAIQGALTAFDGLAELLTDSNDIKRDGGVDNVEELRIKDLQLSDKLANEVHNWANGIAAVEGAGTGTLGLPGLIADIPSLITMSLRVIHKIGLCYGYDCITQTDKQFVYSILSAAGSNSVKEKAASISTLQAINKTIAGVTWKKMAEKATENKFGIEALILAIKQLAKQLGINITRRKALQAIPIIGAGVGAALNIAFINDVAWAARRAYQERWLMENGKIEDGNK